jgi:NADH dehydrogenase (ubiquinone) 1 alpha subcomplex subunit 4
VISRSYVVIGGALTGASWYLHRLATRPDGESLLGPVDPLHRVIIERPADCAVTVVWSRKNPEPWQTVGANENTKLMSGTHKFDKR